MSIKIMNLVWNVEEDCLSMAEKMVLLKMADYSDDAGLKIYPSLETIAKKTCQTKRNVIRVIKSLQTKGYINVLAVGKYRGLSSTYTINLEILSSKKCDRMSPLMSDAKGQKEPSTGDIQSPLTGDTMSPQPPYTTIINNYLTNAPIEKGEITHDSGLYSQLVKKENSKVEQPYEMHREVTEVPSIGIGVPSIEKTQERSVDTPKDDTDTNQLEKKGLKKMEFSFEDILAFKDKVEEMVDIWNETIGKNKVNYSSMSQVNKDDMKKVLEEKLNDSLDLWQKYCKRISLDDFRMGRKVGGNGAYFTINLQWALNSVPAEVESLLNLSTTKDGPQDITPPKDILIKEVFASSEDDWVKRLKAVLVDYMHHDRSHDGLRSFQSYLKTATFEKHETNGKKDLIIRSPYNGYIGLFIYSDLITKACQTFDKITIFDPSSRIGNSLCMERKATNVEEPSDVLKGICMKYGIPMSVLMQTSADEFNTNQTCEV